MYTSTGKCGRHWFPGVTHPLWLLQSLCLLICIEPWSQRGGVWRRQASHLGPSAPESLILCTVFSCGSLWSPSIPGRSSFVDGWVFRVSCSFIDYQPSRQHRDLYKENVIKVWKVSWVGQLTWFKDKQIPDRQTHTHATQEFNFGILEVHCEAMRIQNCVE